MQEEIGVKIILANKAGELISLEIDEPNTVNTRFLARDLLAEMVPYFVSENKLAEGNYELFVQVPDSDSISTLGATKPVTTILLMPAGAAKKGFKPGPKK